MNLYNASRQWAERPDDERFSSLADMLSACRSYRKASATATVETNKLTVGTDGADLQLVGPTGTAAKFTYFSFGQVSRSVGAPADYLRTLPVNYAAANLTYGLQQRGNTSKMLFHKNGSLVLRCMTSEDYSRIWNDDVIERVGQLQSFGWQVPPARPCRADQRGARPATKADILPNIGFGLSVKEGDLIAPAGLYASDHDCFIFMVNEQQRIQDGSEQGLARGFFLSNSEVGQGALKVTSFLYRAVCGNHIVWDAEGVTRLKIVHRGEANARFTAELICELRRYADSSALRTEYQIAEARKMVIADTKEKVLDALFAKLKGDITWKALDASYDRAALDAQHDLSINPNTVWGVVQGITAHSQTIPFTDERTKLDRAAGKLLQIAF